MKNNALIVISFLLLSLSNLAQNWTLKLSSNVELRSWRLTSRADKTQKLAQGATIVLLKGSSVITETTSDANGDFTIEIPGNGDYNLTVSYPGCNTKRFYVSTKNVPDAIGKETFQPSVSIGGFLMSKPINGVDYIGLNEPLVKVEFKNKEEGFDKDEAVTANGIKIVSKIIDDEKAIIEKFCTANKLGDDALNNKNYKLAKIYYQKALEIIPKEEYPTERLKRAEDGIKEAENKEDIKALETAQKVEASKAANQKIIEEKKAQDKDQFQKAADKRIAIEKSKEKKESGDAKTGKAKYSTPKKIGTDPYHTTISKANDHFDKKQYSEAKKQYEEALKIKAKDDFATKRIKEIDHLLKTK